MAKNPLLDRTTSSFGISIGTSLVLESIFGTDSGVYDKERLFDRINIDNYKYHYYNIFTLIRNIYTSVSSTDLTIVLNNFSHKKTVLDILYKEIEVINEAYRSKHCDPVFFLPDYKKVSNKIFIKGNSKLSKKDQIYLNTLSLVNTISKELNEMDMHLLEKTYKLEQEEKDVVITTHIVPDLLNTKSIRKLDLLESHTGVVKEGVFFNTKYIKSKSLDTSKLPFNEILLRLLGDNLILEKPGVNHRNNIEIISQKYKWNPTTSYAKVIANLKTDIDMKGYVNAIIQYSKCY